MKLARAPQTIYQLIDDKERLQDDNKQLRNDNERLQNLLSALHADPAPAPDPPQPAPPTESAWISRLPPSLAKDILIELAFLLTRHPTQRHPSERLRKFSDGIHVISPCVYRSIRSASLPYPSVSTLREFIAPQKAQVASVLAGGDELGGYLQKYRDDEHINDAEVPCVLAFDAAAVSSTGLSKQETAPGSCFAFIMLLLDHRLPNQLVRSISYEHGRMDANIRKMCEQLCRLLHEANFPCHFVATDGDSGMNEYHKKAYRIYMECRGDLKQIVGDVIARLRRWPMP
jgi:hypothetical protein